MKYFIGISMVLMGFIGMTQSHAQPDCTIEVRGQVVDALSGKGLSFASVLLSETGRGGFADSSGRFVIRDICPGTYDMRVTHVGCAPEKVSLDLGADTVITFRMEHDDAILHEFVVEAERDAAQNLTKVSLKQVDLESSSGLQLAEQALALPGMRMVSTGNTITKPVFRGLQGNRFLVLNAGIRQEGQYWGSEHAPEIDPFIAQEISVIEGVDALRYAPDALGGLLLVEPANVFDSDTLAGNISTMGASNGRGGALAGEIMGRFSEKIPLYFRGQASARKFGNARTPEVFLTNTGSEELNFSYALGWKEENWRAEVFYSNFNQKIGIYRYSHLGNLTDLYEVISGIRENPDTSGFSYEIQRPYQNVGHELFKSRVIVEMDENNELEAVYSRQYNSREEFDVHVGFNPSPEALSRSQLDYGLTTHFGEVSWNQRYSDFTRRIGVSGLFRRNTFKGRNFMPNYRNNSFGIFALEQRQLGIWNLKYGARYERYTADIFNPVASEDNPLSLEFDGLSVAVAFRKELENGDFTLSLSSFWRGPAVNELFSNGLHHGAGVIEEGNPDLEKERSYAISATWRKVVGRTRILATGYANFMEDYIFQDPRDIDLTIRGAFPRFNYEQTNALYWGSDVQVEGLWTKGWSYLATGSLVMAQNIQDGSYFINIPAPRISAEIKKTWNDLGKLKAPYFALSANYTTRQFRAPEVYPFETVFEQGAETELPGSFDFAPAPDGYLLVNLQAGVRIGNATIGAGIENVLNTTYRNYMNRFRYYADEPGINFTIRAKYQF